MKEKMGFQTNFNFFSIQQWKYFLLFFRELFEEFFCAPRTTFKQKEFF